MDVNLDVLYQYWVGLPKPERWPEEMRDFPVQAHGKYAFLEGLRLGISFGRLISEDGT